MPDPVTQDEHSSEVAVREHVIAEWHGRLEGAAATLAGEADELGCRRPHRDAHLYEVEEQLRWKADQLREWMKEREQTRGI